MTRRSATAPAIRLAMTHAQIARERTGEQARREELVRRLRDRGVIDAAEGRLLGDSADRRRLGVAIGAALEMADAVAARREGWGRVVVAFAAGVVVGAVLAGLV